jgi:hypothetical protein
MSTYINKKLIALIILVLIAGFAVGYVVNELQNPNLVVSNLGVSNLEWKEPPALTKDVKSAEDVLNDLSGLGCVLINATDFGGPGPYALLDYREFRRVAFNTKVVFYKIEETYVEERKPFIGCSTIWNGFIVTSAIPITL